MTVVLTLEQDHMGGLFGCERSSRVSQGCPGDRGALELKVYLLYHPSSQQRAHQKTDFALLYYLTRFNVSSLCVIRKNTTKNVCVLISHIIYVLHYSSSSVCYANTLSLSHSPTQSRHFKILNFSRVWFVIQHSCAPNTWKIEVGKSPFQGYPVHILSSRQGWIAKPFSTLSLENLDFTFIPVYIVYAVEQFYRSRKL